MIQLDLFCRPFEPKDTELMRVCNIEVTDTTHVAGMLKLGTAGPQEIIVGAYNEFGAFHPLPVEASERVAPGFADMWPQLIFINKVLREILEEGKEASSDSQTQETDPAGE